jgi:TPR repeat protein
MRDTASMGLGIGAVAFASIVLSIAGCESKEQRLISEWQEGCASGDLDKCANLGESYAKGIGVAEDPSKAASIYNDACNRGGARACLLLGDAYASGVGVRKDLAQASAFLGKACDEGEEEGCVHACDALSDAVRCLRVGVLSSKGAKDPKRAATYFRKACDHGHPLGCKELGTMYRDGIGVNKDVESATQFLKRADELLRTACGGEAKPEYCDM